MILYIIRHGETDFNKRGVMQGWMDEPLNESGRFLAAETGKALKDVPFDECFCSPLQRARETAEALLRESRHKFPIAFDERIKEINFGTREGTKLTRDEAELFFTDPVSFGAVPEGESVLDVCRRTQDFLKELIARDDDKTYLISTHGCAMRAMLNWLYENPADYWQGHVPYNCAVNILEAKNGTAKFLCDERTYYDPTYVVDRYKA